MYQQIRLVFVYRPIVFLHSHHHHRPVLIRFFLVSEGGRMHLIPSAIAPTLSLHLARSVASSTLNPIFFIFSTTCFFHVCFGRPRFRGPFTSNIIAFFKMLSSSLLTTCPYHLTPFKPILLKSFFINFLDSFKNASNWARRFRP